MASNVIRNVYGFVHYDYHGWKEQEAKQRVQLSLKSNGTRWQDFKSPFHQKLVLSVHLCTVYASQYALAALRS